MLTDFSLDIYNILAAVNESTRLIFISNPNNPTGSLFPKGTMDELIDSLPEQVILVYYEAYHQYVGSTAFRYKLASRPSSTGTS